jgi:hypothetical protein
MSCNFSDCSRNAPSAISRSFGAAALCGLSIASGLSGKILVFMIILVCSMAA